MSLSGVQGRLPVCPGFYFSLSFCSLQREMGTEKNSLSPESCVFIYLFISKTPFISKKSFKLQADHFNPLLKADPDCVSLNRI